MSTTILSLPLIQEGHFLVTGKRMLVNCLGGLPGNSVDRLTDRGEMTLKVSKSRKTPTQQQNTFNFVRATFCSYKFSNKLCVYMNL